MSQTYDYAVVGGGIVGLSTAYKLTLKFPQAKVLVIEKEQELSHHQTWNNSGVIHSGLYYTPGSLKAENCREGRHELVAFAKKFDVPHDVCGKVIVATDEKELPFMNKIYENGIANQTEGISKITADEVKQIEPFVESIGGIHVACTGIIDYRATVHKLADLIKQHTVPAEIKLGEEVKEIVKGEVSELVTNKRSYNAKRLIFCGGLQADRLAKKDGVNLKEKVVPFRGDYYELTEKAKHKVKHLIYPVPNPDFPFLGVHFTRMTDGEIECGPNAVFSFKREGYNRTSFSFRDTVDALSYSGTWKLLTENTKYAWMEYRRAFSKKLFLETLQRMIPSLEMDDLKKGRSGVRAQLLGVNGETRDDFRIEYSANSIHVLNAPSPAATAGLAIGQKIVDMIKD
ncbi:MAG: L-2-hydroxyglutarate oxidase [Flavobacteriales bacterium]